MTMILSYVPTLPIHALPRQIIEVVIRMAKTMMGHARSKGVLEAKLGLADHLKRLLAGYIRPVAEEIDPNKFREQRCVNQVCVCVCVCVCL